MALVKRLVALVPPRGLHLTCFHFSLRAQRTPARVRHAGSPQAPVVTTERAPRAIVGVASDGKGAWSSDDDGSNWTRASNFPAGNGLLYLASGDLSACP